MTSGPQFITELERIRSHVANGGKLERKEMISLLLASLLEEEGHAKQPEKDATEGS
jgi:hypothetical protein